MLCTLKVATRLSLQAVVVLGQSQCLCLAQDFLRLPTLLHYLHVTHNSMVSQPSHAHNPEVHGEQVAPPCKTGPGLLWPGAGADSRQQYRGT